MELRRRSLLVFFLLTAVWVLVLAWQAEEHFRVRQAAKNDLSNRSKDIANTVSACVRGMGRGFRGTVSSERLEALINELVNGRSNELVKASEVISIVLLNATGNEVAHAGRPIEDLAQKEILQQGERWGQKSVTFVNPVDLGVSVLPRRDDLTNTFPEEARGRPFSRREPESEPAPPTGLAEIAHTNPADATSTNLADASFTNAVARTDRPREGSFRWRRSWMRGMSEQEFQKLMEQRQLHGMVLAISTESLQMASDRDLMLRAIIVALATLSAVGSGLAWRNLSKSSELEIRLVRASELNTHLKEMNLAAAGLAHETRNPLNIIRGLAQMISRREDAPPEIREKTRGIIDETDKVTAQLNEFINYSRPREVRRVPLSLGSVVNEVVRALNFDLEEKKVRLDVKGEQVIVEADDQLLRQALFNLLLNAVQAVDGDGHIEVCIEKRTASEAALEVRDNGPGVPAGRREEIFKPYFTTQKQGTGLGLAVVQQIVLAHGWEIECVQNEPKGALFRISHLKLVV